MEKPDFEKDADVYAEEKAFRVPYDGSNNFYDADAYEKHKADFLKGAEHAYNLSLSRQRELEKENQELKERLAEMDMF